MKFNVHGGHNFKVQGASGCFSETKEDRNVKNLVIAKLQALGHTVYDCTDEDGATQSKNLVNIVNKCNAHSVDLDISIHFNASNGAGHGTEVLVYSDRSKAKSYAQNICNSIAALGFTNRGVKVRSDLYVLRKTNAPSLLIECCFCDNQGDANLYNAEKMADAIVKGILGKTTEVKQNTSTVTQQPSIITTPSAKIKSYLSQGDKGDAVRTMQTMLIACGYSCGKYGADGDFGTGSKNALKSFQKDYGLTVDGLYGNSSKAKLESVYNTRNTANKPTGNDLIRAGQQHTINYTGHQISVDGFYGNETQKNIVRCFQVAMNHDYHKSLAVDGIAGSGTLSALGNHYVKQGESQELVRAVQVALYCHGYNPQGTDAIFGANTKAAVVAFQKAYGLSADGVAGRNTILKLMGK